MNWQVELRRMVDMLDAGRWHHESTLNGTLGTRVEWSGVTVEASAAAWDRLGPGSLGCVNHAELAGRPRGMIRLLAASASGENAVLHFGVRRSTPWNHFEVIRDGFANMCELVDSDGVPVYPYFDFGAPPPTLSMIEDGKPTAAVVAELMDARPKVYFREFA